MGKKPTVSHLRNFGSVAYVHMPKQFTKKFDLRGRKTILMRYESDSTNYRVYDPDTKRVSVTRDAKFYEQVGKVVIDKEESCDDATILRKSKNEVGVEELGHEVEEPDKEEAVEFNEEVQDGSDEQPREEEVPKKDLLCILEQHYRPVRYEVDVAEYNSKLI